MNLPGYIDAILEFRAERRRRSRCYITGNSMAPLIRHGDRLEIDHDPGELRPGDVVVFRREGALVAHRLIRCDRIGPGERLVTRGDGCAALDPPVARSQVIGRVTRVWGPERSLALESPWWRWFGRSLASVVAASESRDSRRPPPGWHWRLLFSLRAGLLPARVSAIDLLLRFSEQLGGIRSPRGTRSRESALPVQREGK